jgi:hypothetical protein
VKLWHDDIRRPPDDSWVWARTNEEAVRKLGEGGVEILSLDYDLGLEHIEPGIRGADFMRGPLRGEGMRLVEWMLKEQIFPQQRIEIHSMDPEGAQTMYKALRASLEVLIIPFDPSCRAS